MHSSLIINLDLTLDPSVQPSHSLEVSTFLSERLLRHTQVRTDRKAVFSVGVQARLIGLVAFEEYILNVGPVRRCVARVQVCERNADGGGDGIPLRRLCVGRVGSETSVNALACGKVTSGVFAAEAVAHRPDSGDVVGGADGVERGVDDGLNICQRMTLLPVRQAVV